jgi:CelD/BcsL family acetyltransferase involved in cellulose biosynthesis
LLITSALIRPRSDTWSPCPAAQARIAARSILGSADRAADVKIASRIRGLLAANNAGRIATIQIPASPQETRPGSM